MLIDLTFKNYRSLKETQSFSLQASAFKLKTENTFFPLDGDSKLCLLKSAVIYGANASGKSNLIRLMWTFKRLVLDSSEWKVADPIPDRYYDPFLLDTEFRNAPIEISLHFILQDKKRYRYAVRYNKSQILYEYLGVYESSRISKIFERRDGNEFVEFGDAMKNKREDKRVSANTLYLSKFGSIPNDQIRDIYLYFKQMEIWNIPAVHHTEALYKQMQKKLDMPENEVLRQKLSKLIRIADTQIEEVLVRKRPYSNFENLPEDIRERIGNDFYLETLGVHAVFDDEQKQGEVQFSFRDQESQGTRMLFAIGGLILEAFEKKHPTVIFLDEFDNSLHPNLAKFLVELFHIPQINKNNSQLVFATHETTLLDKKIFRKDQIWFGDKNKYGATSLYSVKDFDDLKHIRSDIPFDKWYKTGKFGAVPNIKKMEFIAEYE